MVLIVPKSESSDATGKKVYTVKDIIPPGDFIIDILDMDHTPIKDTDFSVSVDDGDPENKRTDNEGTIRIARPKVKFDLYLYSEGGSGDEIETAEEFVLKILDHEQKPVKDVLFSVAVDGGKAKDKRTDEDGIIRIAKPETEFNISLADQDGSAEAEPSSEPDMEEIVEEENIEEENIENEVLTPVSLA